MASSPSTRIRAELQAAGENLNTWGAPKLNSAIQRLEEAICGMYSTALSGNATLTSANYSADQARMAFLNFTSGTGGTITVPAVEKTYFVRNATTGDVTITTGSGTTATVKSGNVAWVASDATNVYAARERDFGGATLTNIATPSASTDVVRKDYADALLVTAKAYTDSTAFTANAGILPGQGGNSGKFLTTNGTTASWGSVPGSVWTSISSSVALVAGSSNEVDTSAARALTLPATPGAGGGAIRVSDRTGNAATNNITVTPNGSETMNGVASDPFIIDIAFYDVTFIPVAGGWRTVYQ